MDYNDTSDLNMAYLASNAVGIIFLFVAMKWTKIARIMFAVLFGYAFWINYSLSHANPEAYLAYAETSADIYTKFIHGWFSERITPVITLIAFGQLFIALGMMWRNSVVLWASVGIILFLLAIAPLGYYAAFPFSITVSLAAVVIILKDDRQFPWKRSRQPGRHAILEGEKKAIARTLG